jgi:hypothetical protein
VLVAGSSSTDRKKAEWLRPREGTIAAVENLSPAHGRFKFDDALKATCFQWSESRAHGSAGSAGVRHCALCVFVHTAATRRS